MFNALKYTRQLEAVGFTRRQAEAHIQIMTEVIETSLATKQDFKELEGRMTKMFKDAEAKTDKKFVEFEYRIVTRLAAVAVTVATLCTTPLLIKFF